MTTTINNNTVEYNMECARDAYRGGNFGATVNALNRALAIDPEYKEAQVMLLMVQEILDCRFTDMYNP